MEDVSPWNNSSLSSLYEQSGIPCVRPVKLELTEINRMRALISSVPAQLLIMDTGEFLTLSFHDGNAKMRTVIEDLYKEMNIDVTGFQIPIENLKMDDQDLVFNILPSYFSSSHATNKTIVEYVNTILKYDSLCKSFNKVNALQSNKNDTVAIDKSPAGKIAPVVMPSSQFTETLEGIVDEVISNYSPLNAFYEIQQIEEQPVISIVFNVLYSMCVVLIHPDPQKICDRFREFTLLKSINKNKNNDSKWFETFKDLFHTKVFANIKEATDKVNSFIILYDIDKPNQRNKALIERDNVHQLLRREFVLSDDPAERMMALELYNIICAKLNISDKDVGFKARLPSHLINIGLKKKRITQGNCYFGIKVKTTFTQGELNEMFNKVLNERDAGVTSLFEKESEQRETEAPFLKFQLHTNEAMKTYGQHIQLNGC